MPELCSFDYAVIRIVPRVERQEFMNAGVIVSCADRNFLEARIEVDERRLAALDSTLDLETIRGYLQTIPVICAGGPAAGPLAELPQRARFHWLVAPRSTIIQTSPVHSGLTDDPATTLEHLLEKMVRRAGAGSE
jgi:hypothetical protein